jgi:hypothetical protein
MPIVAVSLSILLCFLSYWLWNDQHAIRRLLAMTSREEQILKPRNPSLDDDENEWEEFSLTDVKILLPGKSRYANLLATTPENPVRVIGCLDELEEEQAHLGTTPP